MAKFKLVIHGEYDLDDNNFWPDKDAPLNASTYDAAEVLASHITQFSVGETIMDWDLYGKLYFTITEIREISTVVSGRGELLHR